jgi:serine/threonine-protein kinase RsbW
VRLRVPGDPLGVRAGLSAACAALAAAGVAEPELGAAEIALAEVMNNIAEHAYAAGPGPIALRIGRCDATGALVVVLLDCGAAMPGLRLPPGEPPLLDGPADDLPEGGFGWFLIRSLAADLDYRRRAGCNRLRFRLGAQSAPAA